MDIHISENKNISKNEMIGLLKSVNSFHTKNPDEWYVRQIQSDSLISVWDDDELVGIGNAMINENKEVSFSGITVSPDYQDIGIEDMIMQRLEQKYPGFTQTALPVEGNAEKPKSDRAFFSLFR